MIILAKTENEKSSPYRIVLPTVVFIKSQVDEIGFFGIGVF